MCHDERQDRLAGFPPLLDVHPDPANSLAKHTGMAGRHIGAKFRGCEPRFKIGDAVHRHCGRAFTQQHRGGDCVDARPEVHSALLEDAAAEAQAGSGIVVAAGEDYLCPGRGDACKRFIEQPHNVHSGEGTVIDVPGDQDRINMLAADGFQELVNEGVLRLEHPHAVE